MILILNHITLLWRRKQRTYRY